MIYVTIGGSKIPFYRLISQIDVIAQEFKQETFIVQQGITNYNFMSKNVKSLQYCTFEESDYYIRNASIIISHAGTGTIVQAKQYGIVTIIVPRLKKYKEHVDDHQLDIARHLQENDKEIFVVYNVSLLKETLNKALKIKKQKSLVNNEGKKNIIKTIRKFIEDNLSEKQKVLVINSLDSTYGSTHRIRKLYGFIKDDTNFETKYIESNTDIKNAINIKQKNNFLGFLFGSVKRVLITLITKFDILFTQTITPLTVGSILIAKFKGKKVVVDWDDLSWVLQKNRFRAMMVKFCEHIFIKFVDIIFVPNKYLMEYGEKIGIKKIYFVPHGIDFEIFDPGKYDEERVRFELNIRKDRIVLGFLASFTTGGVGDLDFIFDVVKDVIEVVDVDFLVIGGGPLFEEYVSLSKKIKMKNIYFTGLIKHQEVPKYLSCIDIALIYMRNNIKNKMKTSLKVGEYLAMNKIVVGHLVGQTKDDFEKYCICSDVTKEDFKDKIVRTILEYKNLKKTLDVRNELKKFFLWDNIGAIVKKNLMIL